MVESKTMKIKAGPSNLRHPGRYRHKNWETEFEHLVNKPEKGALIEEFTRTEGCRPMCWGHLALNRDMWRLFLL